ncbi:MAG: SAF domain-containing protein, partial [Rhizobium altiplani]|uniref:SAF domain-containing protein n=1 Tax=Rhizobium altiplani TaxID=1864509 RepID=UPI0030F0F761
MSSSNTPVILLNTIDDVAVARVMIRAGGLTGIEGLVAVDQITRGHKIAIRDIAAGEEVRKFGQPIGVATIFIPQGSHVHLHNLAVVESEHRHQFSVDIEETGMLPLDQRRTFMGFDRGAGGVGTRNFIGIVTTVN